MSLRLRHFVYRFRSNEQTTVFFDGKLLECSNRPSAIAGLPWRHAIKRLTWIKKVIERQPKASRVMEKKQRKDDRKGHPDGELLVNRHRGERIKQKEPGHGDRDRGCVIDVDRTDEVTLLTLELKLAMWAVLEHFERFCVELSDAATRTA